MLFRRVFGEVGVLGVLGIRLVVRGVWGALEVACVGAVVGVTIQGAGGVRVYGGWRPLCSAERAVELFQLRG